MSTLPECLGIEHLLVTRDWGVYWRIQAKATAFGQARHFNRVLGAVPLHVARYAVCNWQDPLASHLNEPAAVMLPS
jgi:hypothetical protein